MTKNGGYQACFELQVVKAEIKGVFNLLYCYYGNRLHHKNDHILLTSD